jgi:cell division protein FtsL
VSPAEAERERLFRAAQGAVQATGPARPEPEQLEPLEQPEQAARHLRLVDRDARRRTNRRHAIVLVAITGIAVVCLALVALHVLIAENQFRLDRLQQQASAQQAHYEKLRLEVAQLEAPARIVGLAEDTGMRQPASVIYLPATSAPSAGGTTASSAAPTTAKAGSGAARRAAADPAPGARATGTVTAPVGDADWPTIKQYLSGSP